VLPPKNLGDAWLRPRGSLPRFSEEFYLFFFLAAFFFAAILFSSQTSEFSARFSGGARIQFTCIDSDAFLVKRKVSDAEKKWSEKTATRWPEVRNYFSGGAKKRLRATNRTPEREARTLMA